MRLGHVELDVRPLMPWFGQRRLDSAFDLQMLKEWLEGTSLMRESRQREALLTKKMWCNSALHYSFRTHHENSPAVETGHKLCAQSFENFRPFRSSEERSSHQCHRHTSDTTAPTCGAFYGIEQFLLQGAWHGGQPLAIASVRILLQTTRN